MRVLTEHVVGFERAGGDTTSTTNSDTVGPRSVLPKHKLPDFAFLVASVFSWVALVGFRWKQEAADVGWWINLSNSIGSVSFMVAALGALVLPTTGEMVNIVLVNAGTFVGPACFLVGGYLLWPPAPAHVAAVDDRRRRRN